MLFVFKSAFLASLLVLNIPSFFFQNLRCVLETNSPVLNTLLSIVFVFNNLVFTFNNNCDFKRAKFNFVAKLDVSKPAATFKSAFVS